MFRQNCWLKVKIVFFLAGLMMTGESNALAAWDYASVSLEDVEPTLEEWGQSTEDTCDWLVNSGSTPSNLTGPSADHTYGSQAGHYVYLEEENIYSLAPHQFAYLVSNDFTSGTVRSISFAYHMYGEYHMGELSLEYFDSSTNTWNQLWSKQGNQGDVWMQANLDLTGFTVGKLRFRGESGYTSTSDMALDDIKIYYAGTDNETAYLPGDAEIAGDLFVGKDVLIGSNLSVTDRTVIGGELSVKSIGSNNIITGNGAIGLGADVTASGDNALAFGSSTFATGLFSTAGGNLTHADGIGSFSIGLETNASGKGSTAMGWGATAAEGSTAMGHNTLASGFYSTAMGYGTKASMYYSTAMGYLSEASMYYSTAMGYRTTASGYNSTAIGNFTKAYGDSSTTMGYNTNAYGSSSTAMGYGTTSYGSYSTAMGYRTSANGFSSTASGYNSKSSGSYSIASGYFSNSSGYNSFANGYYANSSGSYSTSMGYRTNASGYFSLAMGYYTNANGGYSTAIGANTYASGYYSTTMGAGTNASGYYSTAMGNYTTAQAQNSLVVGRYNKISGDPYSWLENDPLFVVGNGTSTSTPSNALTVLKNGNVGIKTSDPKGAALYVAGAIVAMDGITVESDRRLKKDITPLEDSLDKVMNLRGVNYSWRTEEFPDRGFSEKRQIGFIAQEVEEVVPEVVRTNDEGMKSVAYDKLTALLVEAVKELKDENTALKELVCQDHPEAKVCKQ